MNLPPEIEIEIALYASSPMSLFNAPQNLGQLSSRLQQRMLAAKSARQAPSGSTKVQRGGIAVIPLPGMISQRPNVFTMCNLGVATQQFTQSLRSTLADPSIDQILIDIDSPGGSVYGVQELADEIYAARSTKPVIGIANSLAASAAYWIGASCSELYCTPGGEVGSIGVYTEHLDMSKALEMDGQTMSLISAGKFKTEGNPYGPLSIDARAAIQKSVDSYYTMFTKSVSRGRGVALAKVKDGMGQGRCLNAQQALQQNMVDGVINKDQLLARMAAGKSLQRNNISAHTKNTIRALSLGVNLPAKPSQPLTVAEAELRFNQSEKKYLNGLKRLKSN
jgi:signal peptide peptidase SppA